PGAFHDQLFERSSAISSYRQKFLRSNRAYDAMILAGETTFQFAVKPFRPTSDADMAIGAAGGGTSIVVVVISFELPDGPKPFTDLILNLYCVPAVSPVTSLLVPVTVLLS